MDKNFFPSDIEPNIPQNPEIDKAPGGNTRVTSLDVLCVFDSLKKSENCMFYTVLKRKVHVTRDSTIEMNWDEQCVSTYSPLQK